MKEKYLINARIIDPKNDLAEIGGLIIESTGLLKASTREQTGSLPLYFVKPFPAEWLLRLLGVNLNPRELYSFGLFAMGVYTNNFTSLYIPTVSVLVIVKVTLLD